MTEKQAAAAMALEAEAAKRNDYDGARRNDEARYLAELITAAGWSSGEIIQLAREYDYESCLER